MQYIVNKNTEIEYNIMIIYFIKIWLVGQPILVSTTIGKFILQHFFTFIFSWGGGVALLFAAVLIFLLGAAVPGPNRVVSPVASLVLLPIKVVV